MNATVVDRIRRSPVVPVEHMYYEMNCEDELGDTEGSDETSEEARKAAEDANLDYIRYLLNLPAVDDVVGEEFPDNTAYIHNR